MGKPSDAKLAREYERRFPGALTDDAHKAERMQRELVKDHKREHRRTGDQYFTFENLPVDEHGRLRP